MLKGKQKVLEAQKGSAAGCLLCCSCKLYLKEVWEALPEYAGGLSEEPAVFFAEQDKFKGQGCVVEELSRDISE